MHRRSSLVHVIGLVAILVSLFNPLIALQTSAQDEVPAPEVSLTSDAGTPGPVDPVVEPTLVPTEAPTLEPTLEPTAGPTTEPTLEPTAEPSPEPTIEPTAAPTEATEEDSGNRLAPQSSGGISTLASDWASVSVTPDQQTVSPGSPVGFTIRVRMLYGQYFNTNVTLPSAPGLTWTTASNPYNCDFAADPFCFYGVAVDQTVEFRITSNPVPASACGTLTLTAEAQGSETASASASVTAICPPKLEIQLSGPDSVVTGDEVAYTATMTNSGTGPATTADLSLSVPDLPGGWTVTKPDDILCGTSQPSYSVSCGLITGATLAPGASFSVTLKGTVPNDTGRCDASITANASITTGGTGSDSVSTKVACRPNVSVTLSGPASATSGVNFVQTMTVTNSGTAPASNVSVSLPLPVPPQEIGWGTIGRCDGNFPSGPAVCTIPSLAPNQSAIFTATFRPTASTCGPYTFQAMLSGGATGTSNTVTTTVTCPEPELGISISGSGVRPIDSVEYTFTISNTGLGAASGVGFVSDLPDFGGTWTLESLTSGSCTITGTQLACTGLTVAPGGSASAMVQVWPYADPALCSGVPTITATLTGTSITSTPFGTTFICNPDLTLSVKVASVTSGGITTPVADNAIVTGLQPGDTVNYVIPIENTGDVNLTGLAIDTSSGSLGNSCLALVHPDLQFEASRRAACDVWYTITESDVLAGQLTNTVTVSTDQTGETTRSVTVYMALPSPELSLQVTPIEVNGSPVTGPVENLDLGDVVTYRVTAANAGNLSLSGVTISSDTAGVSLAACPAVNLALQASTTCTATHTVTQADVDAGTFTASFSTTGTGPHGELMPTSGSATVTMLQVRDASLAVDTAYVAPTDGAPLGSVAYTFTVTNTGTTTLDGVIVRETGFTPGAGQTCTIDAAPVSVPATLGRGRVMECTSAHTVSQRQMDGGIINHSAQVVSDQVVSDRIPIQASLPRNPQVSISSELAIRPEDGFDRFDTATSTITVKNTGNVTLRNLSLSDTNQAVRIDCGVPGVDVPEIIPSLAPRATATCSATLMITQEDVDAGGATMTSTVRAYAPAGTEPASVDATADVLVIPTHSVPEITLQNNAYENSQLLPGQPVSFAMIATNTGTVRLTGVEITSQMADISTLQCVDAGGHDLTQPVTLERGEMMRCVGVYTPTQDDLDRGSIENPASVSGVYGETSVDDTATGTLDRSGTRDPHVAITTGVSQQHGVVADQELTYTFTVRNTGNVTLTNIQVSDDTVTGIDCGDGTNIIGKLAPNTPGVDCTGTWTITQAFIDAYMPGAGEFFWTLTTTATVSADAPQGTTPAQVSDERETSVSGNRVASAGFAITALQVDGEDVPLDQPVTGLQVGQVVTYTLTATNTGQVTLSAATITTPDGGTLACGDDASSTLAPGATLACTGTLEITRDAFESNIRRLIPIGGQFAAEDPQRHQISRATATEIGLAAAEPMLELALGVSPERVDRPQDVEYTLTLTNTGNVTLTGVSVPEHPRLDLSSMECDIEGWRPSSTISTLAVGQTVTCSVPSTITQDDIDAGADIDVTTHAIASSRLEEAVVSNDATALLAVVQQPDIAISKTTNDPTTGLDRGESVVWQVKIENTGNVTLKNVTVIDDRGEISCPAGDALSPAESVTCEVIQVVTEEDLIAGEAVAITTVSALTPDGATLSREATSTLTTVAPHAALEVTQSATILRDGDPVSAGPAQAGDTIALTVVVQNPGNITIHDLDVSSSLPGTILTPESAARPGILAFAQVGETRDLAPGASLSFTATYTVTTSDAAAGTLTISSIAHGSGHDGEVSAESEPLVITIARAQPEPTMPATPEPSTTPGPTATPAAPVVSALPSTGADPAPTLAMGWLVTITLGALLAIAGLALRRRTT